MRTLPWIPALLAVLCTANTLSAQVISGRLLDADSGEPISNATVLGLDESDDILGAVLTDRDGAFRIADLPSGRVILRAQRIGYQTSSSEAIEVAPGQTLSVEFRLSTSAVVLAPLTVTAAGRPWWETERPPLVWGYHERMERYGTTGFGRYITPGDLELLKGAPAWDILASPIGYRIRVEMQARGRIGRRVTVFGCDPVYFLDGLRSASGIRTAETIMLDNLAAFSTISALTADDRIEGIEIYHVDPAKGGHMPPHFASQLRSDESCVIAIWRREPPSP